VQFDPRRWSQGPEGELLQPSSQCPEVWTRVARAACPNLRTLGRRLEKFPLRPLTPAPRIKLHSSSSRLIRRWLRFRRTSSGLAIPWDFFASQEPVGPGNRFTVCMRGGPGSKMPGSFPFAVVRARRASLVRGAGRPISEGGHNHAAQTRNPSFNSFHACHGAHRVLPHGRSTGCCAFLAGAASSTIQGRENGL